MRLRTAQGGWVLTLLACLLITGCTTTVAGQPHPAGSSPAAAGAGEPTKAPRPVDRDMQAVTVAMRRLDACAVFDLDAAKPANPNATLLPIGPHACMLAPTTNYNPAQDGVKVFVGAADNDLVRNTGAPVTIAGAKAYERRDYSSPNFKQCELDLPVSFSRAIQFSYRASETDTCQVLRQVAAAAVPRLQNPDALTVDPAKRPFAAWDGCFFLAQLLGAEAQNFTYEPDGVKDPFSGCRTRAKKPQGPQPKGESTGAPSAGGTGGASPPQQPNEPELEVAYDKVPTAPKQPRQVAGKVADITTYSSRCKLTWNQGDSQAGNQWHAALVISMTAASCDGAAQLAERAVALVDQQPSDADAAPQRPLLFKPEDNDSPEPGACVDWNGDAGCEPYHPVPVPEGIEKILAAADRDQDVTCAVFHDAVKSLFGSTFNPVTWGEHCFFVEATHTLILRCNVDGQNPPSDYGRRTDLWTDRQEIQLAGKPAVTFWDKNRTDFDVYLSPFGDLTRDGNLHINVDTRLGRGDTSLASGRPKLDPAKAELARQVITQITQRYVTG